MPRVIQLTESPESISASYTLLSSKALQDNIHMYGTVHCLKRVKFENTVGDKETFWVWLCPEEFGSE